VIRDYWWVNSQIFDYGIGAGDEEIQDPTLVVRWGVDVLSETEGSKKLGELFGVDIWIDFSGTQQTWRSCVYFRS
jgi:hypothetical protein